MREETGVELAQVQLLRSQPWPIGRAGSCELMLGCIARAAPAPFGGLPEATKQSPAFPFTITVIDADLDVQFHLNA